MLARRLLTASRGGGGFTLTTAVRDLGVSGFWNDVTSPRAAHYNGKTYLGWVNDSGDIQVAEYVHSTGLTSTPVTVATGTSSPFGVLHNSPSILVRSSDRKIIVAAVSAGGSNKPAVWVSSNAEDATAFGSATLLDPAGDYVYTDLVEVGGTIYLFGSYASTGTQFHLTYRTSTDNGATWGALTDLIQPVSTDATYWRVGTNGSRIDIFCTDTNRVASPSSLYHFYISGTTLYQSDGTSVGAIGSGPYTATAGTLVQDDSLGAARCDGWGYDGSGNPAALILINDADADTNTLARHAIWTGTAWSVHAVASAGGTMANVYISSGTMVKNDPSTIWFPRKVGSHFEMFRYTSGDNGATWGGSALTSGSSSDNAMPDSVMDAGTGLQVVWGLGSFTSDDVFSFAIKGWG